MKDCPAHCITTPSQRDCSCVWFVESTQHGRSRLSRLLEPTSGMVLVPQVWCKGHLCLAERSHRLALCNSGALLSKQSPQIQEGFQESLCSRQG